MKRNVFSISSLKYFLVLMSILLMKETTFSQTQNSSSDQKVMDDFISNLISKMTLEEKIGQLNLPSIGFDVTGPVMSKDVELNIKKGLVGGVFNTFTPIAVKKLQEIAIKETRMKIPLLMGYDVIHGHRTIFPIPLGLSSSWDTDLIKKTARAAALEASADGLNWVFSPMVDIARDPRWGRVSEGAGEDTYLGSAISKAMVDGYQNGDMANNNSVMACIKHFALYGAAESGRDYNTTDMSLNRMYNEYLPPYKAGIDAGAGSLMSSFNAINGVPATGSYWLMTDLLRKQWGFKGLVATDYTAINEMVNHGVGDEEEVTRLAITAPVQMDMVGELFLKKLPDLVKSGKVNEKLIDDACRLVLESKYKLGLFKDPYRGISEKKAKAEIMSADKLQLAKESAIKSMVLLKNEKQLLPLNLNQKIAFIGPFVKDKRNLLGNWSGAGDWKKAISIWESLSKRLDSSKILYAKGCNMVDEPSLIAKLNPHDAQLTLDKKSPKELIEEAKLIAAKADVLVVCLGETFGMSGEAASLSDIRLLENQRNLLIELKKIGKPIVLVLTNGRPLELSWEANNVDAILETWISGTMAGEAICDVLFGNANPSGKLSMTFPRSVGQIPIYYNVKNTGRPFDENQKYTSKYLDIPNTPLFPFGFGMSYTSYTYSDIKLNKNSFSTNDSVIISAKITNSGNRAGEEIAQLYVRDMIASISRPVKELKGFQKVKLNVGESKTVQFVIKASDLAFYNNDLKLVTEAGEFRLGVGKNSDVPLDLSVNFN